jgi:hypothetical protein
MREKREKRKKVQKGKKNDADQGGDSFIPSMKMPERDFLDGALVGAGSLRPMLITREANFRSTYGEF